MGWYNSLCLKGRILTSHERKSLESYVSTVGTDDGEMIKAKGTVVKRPMDLKLTHYHHTNALLALMSCYIDSGCQTNICYPS